MVKTMNKMQLLTIDFGLRSMRYVSNECECGWPHAGTNCRTVQSKLLCMSFDTNARNDCRQITMLRIHETFWLFTVSSFGLASSHSHSLTDRSVTSHLNRRWKSQTSRFFRTLFRVFDRFRHWCVHYLCAVNSAYLCLCHFMLYISTSDFCRVERTMWFFSFLFL